jgi:catechol 2,3-dioxygenase-like lactoylglutathione lyase family enzyme
MVVSGIDHLVLTVFDIEETRSFYEKGLGMESVVFGEIRVALKFGSQKISLYALGGEIEPKTSVPTPGSADLCFITPIDLNKAITHAESHGVEIIEGPVKRTGANGEIQSFYFRDPDSNLIELANEVVAK